MLLEARDEEGQPLTDLELRDELMTLLLAGHETTATALSWTLERLVRHPDVVARLRAERRRGEEASPYLEATIKEALRLRPVVTAVGRHLTAPLEIGGHLLPAGVSINPSIYLLHRRPDLYPEPEAFRPERFLDDPPGTYQWIPFGGGVRRCLGASFALYRDEDRAPDHPRPGRPGPPARRRRARHPPRHHLRPQTRRPHRRGARMTPPKARRWAEMSSLGRQIGPSTPWTGWSGRRGRWSRGR